MKPRIHFVVRAEPIVKHGKDELALCGHLIERAEPVVIVPDAVVVSLGIIASTFGSKMCRHCQNLEPGEGYCYFMATAEFVSDMRTVHVFSEVS